MEFLGDCGTAYDVSPLEHCDLETRRREICRADQAVVASTDDQDIT